MSNNIYNISNWVAGNQYSKNDIVINNNLYYYASFPHVSTSSFSNDLVNGNWFGYLIDNAESKPFFNWKSSYKHQMDFQPKVKIIQFGDSYKQVSKDGISNNLPILNLPFENIDLNKTTAILHFLDLRAGAESFMFLPPAPLGNLSRFICNKYTHTQNFYDNYTIQASFERTIV